MGRRFHLRLPLVWIGLSLLLTSAKAFSDSPPFDLAGPKVDVHVQRQGKTLPIAQVPNLLPGDRLWIHPDLPESESVHYLLIVAFLRGSTNQPPPEWFKRVETWNRQVREEGVFVVVPAEAQQALIFLAPETGGDFSTLRAAVRGRPGAFVRASQDLQLASWDRLRLDAYLAEVKRISLAAAKTESTATPAETPAETMERPDAKSAKERTELAARSLGIRVDQQCFDKPTEQQAPCLVQHPDGLVMDDSNVQNMVTQLTNGSAADMMNQLSWAPLAGAGSFSPYVGALVDLVRILSTVHTAKYQYIPALALPQLDQGDALNLRLNVPPSFRDPKSVIVVALPPIGPSHPPQLHAPEPPAAPAQKPGENTSPNGPQNLSQAANSTYCATKPDLALASEGAPLVFATGMAYDLTLHLQGIGSGIEGTKIPGTGNREQGTAVGAVAAHDPSLSPEPKAANPAKAAQYDAGGVDIPVRADATLGGFVLEKTLPEFAKSEVVAELRGKWGFDTFEGPKFHLVAPHAGGWVIPASDQNALITGREDTLHIQGASTLCVAQVEAKIPPAGSAANPAGHEADAKPLKLTWKSPKPDLLEVEVPLKNSAPGTVAIGIRQYGLPAAEELSLQAYAEAASIDHLTLSAGDKVAQLKGKRLDEVDSADLAGISFAPAALNRVQDFDQLAMSATGVTATLKPGSDYLAKVTLRDGRTLHVPATVDAPRPQVDLLSKGIQHDVSEADAAAPPPVRLGSARDLPLERKLVFFLRSRVPVAFDRKEKVEIAAVDPTGGSFQTTLSFADGSLMLEDAHTAVAVIDPLARFGPSAFGPIQLRAITAEGTTGDWVQLGTLVRLPAFSASSSLRCSRNPAKPCQLTGTNLFLVTAVGATPDMANAQEIPPDFTGSVLTVPNIARPGTTGTLYLRLRDDPETVQTLSLPVTAPLPGAAPAAADSVANAAPPVKPDPGAPVEAKLPAPPPN